MIYIVFLIEELYGLYPKESKKVLGVFSSEEKAKGFIKEIKSNYDLRLCKFIIETYTVQS